MDNIGYKIVEMDNGKLKTLFHGNFGTRTLLKEVWMPAQVRPEARDGKGKTYKSGWHLFTNINDAEYYMRKFKTRLDKLRLVEVEYKGDRVKPTNSSVILADEIKIIDVVGDYYDFVNTNYIGGFDYDILY